MNDSSRALETGGVVILITALVYVGGWSYAYHWYAYFELGLISLDIPLEHYFIYSFLMLMSDLWLALLIALVPILTLVAMVFWTRVRLILILTLPLWVLLAFLLVYSLGKLAADADYREHQASGFQSYSWVRVWSKPDSDDLPPKLQKVRQDLADGKYRLLLETVHSLYLIRPNQDGGQIPTLQVRRDQVRAMRRIPTNPGS